MTENFRDKGRSLLSNGYLIIPITPGEKRPAIGGWQKSRLGASDLTNYPGHGVGILTGQGAHPIIGVDIDVSNQEVCDALVEWCRTNIGYGCERVGAKPRVLITYRAAEAGWAKGNSTAFIDENDKLKPNGKANHQRIEILGLGQQFVAYHTHPDTGEPYEWVDMFSGIEYVSAADLPVVTLEHIDGLFAELDRLIEGRFEILYRGDAPSGAGAVSGGYAGTGSTTDDDEFLLSLVPTCGLSQTEMSAALDHIENADVEYDTWLRIGMAIHHESGGEEWGRSMWNAWSARSTKHVKGSTEKKWGSFAKTGRNPTTFRWVLKMASQSKADAEIAGKRTLLNELREQIRSASDEFDLTGAIAKSVRDKMTNDSAIRGQVIALFQHKFQELTSTKIPLTEVKKLLVERAVPTVRQARPLTEFGNAERMLDKFGDGLMYVPEISTWYCWNGVYWRKANIVEIEHLAKETVRSLATEIDNHQDPAEFYAFCAMSQQARMVRNMVTLAASDPRVMVPASELDKDPNKIGMKNGVLDLRTGVLLPADPQHRITLNTRVNYNPSAQCPLFLETISDVFSGDKGLTDFFLTAMGYALMGQPKEDMMFIAFGNGSNGKSTIIGTIREAFGGYARAADASSFISDAKGGGGGAGAAREDLVRLRGARLVYVNEPDENGELREGAVKSMTGGDAISARGLYAKESIEIMPSWVVIMPTNHKPIVKGSDNGIWRRLGMIPFERDFDNDKTVVKDPHREDKLKAELEGIFALVFRYAQQYQKTGLVQPKIVKSARDSYRTQMDLLSEWLEDCCITGDGLSAESSALWLSWEQFAKTNGILHYVKSSVALGRRLDSRFPAIKGAGGVRKRLGISLRVAGVAG